MATFTVTKPLFGASAAAGSTANTPYFTSVVVDFSEFTTASGDTVEAVEIPANSMVLTAGAEVISNDASATPTIAIQLNAVVFCVATAIDSGTLAAGLQFPGQDAVAEMFLTSDTRDTIDAVLAGGAALTTGIIRVWAMVVDLDDPVTEQRVTFA